MTKLILATPEEKYRILKEFEQQQTLEDFKFISLSELIELFYGTYRDDYLLEMQKRGYLPSVANDLKNVLWYVKDSKREKIEQRTSRKEKQFAINKNKLSPTNNSDAIIVEDMKNCFVKISKCCDPVPGDNIVGFITKGYGVSVHRCDCKNILNHSSKKEDLCRLANVSWAENILDYFDTKIEIIANNDPDFLSDVSNKLISIHLKYKSMNIKILEDNKMSLTIEAKVKNLDHLMFILKSFSHIKNTLSIKRI